MAFYTKPSTEEFLEFVQDLLLEEQQTDEHYDEPMDGFCFLDVTDDSVALHAADGSCHMIVDSGAFPTLTNNPNMIQHNAAGPGGSITQANGSALPVEKCGTGSILTDGRDLSLSQVLFVPNLSHDLLSVSSTCDDLDAFMLFDSDRVLICKGNISDLAGIEVIATGTRNNGLYYLSYQLPSPGTALLGKKKHRNRELHPQHHESFLIWHLQAGHISSIKRTVELQVGRNLP